ncbi:MAG: hypothetical protein OEX18_15615 [Candidatus Krumholzibacteria bacterium]|nr:hypothetical protein [Candidatus Krumholzibacteria bacterium]MDH5271361.1 hypothetical protein [Candidatus Krumholzibacteria bacterium]
MNARNDNKRDVATLERIAATKLRDGTSPAEVEAWLKLEGVSPSNAVLMVGMLARRVDGRPAHGARVTDAVTKRQITRVSVRQSSKVLTLFYVVTMLLLCVPVGLIMMAWPQMRLNAVMLLMMPVVYGIICYPLFALGGAIYNAIAVRVGGVEFESADKPDAA